VRIAFSLLLAGAATPALAVMNIFACTPEWGALATQLGGDKVSVYVATTALQDPHRIEARPSLIARARSADLAVCNGAELEIGWMPLVQQQSGNAKIQAGQPGYFEAASVVQLLEKQARVDRSMGDVHPAGNPHLHMDPRNIERAAAALGERMAAIDPANKNYFGQRTADFLSRWREAIARWEKQAVPLKDVPVITHHKNMTYLLHWLGMRELGSLEPKPGLPPTTAHLTSLLRTPAKLVVRAAYNDARPAEWLGERAKIRVVVLPYTVGGNDKAKDLFSLFDDTIGRLLAP